MAEDIKQFSEEIKKHFNEKTEEIKHHMDVVAEDLKGQIQQVAEGVIVSNERLDRLEPLVEKVEAIKDDVEVIKVTVNAIKRDLKQKADREELSALELKLRPA
ncbi:MAG TPA: hypothetical protein VJC15_03810 [Candidatus Paceibacterota bacterium]